PCISFARASQLRILPRLPGVTKWHFFSLKLSEYCVNHVFWSEIVLLITYPRPPVSLSVIPARKKSIIRLVQLSTITYEVLIFIVTDINT
ncbi:MAG: hypothetical protein WA941_11450, partial [Nitrososphaeraceae archaeon]